MYHNVTGKDKRKAKTLSLTGRVLQSNRKDPLISFLPKDYLKLKAKRHRVAQSGSWPVFFNLHLMNCELAVSVMNN